jgi:hypothetical protein
VLSLRCHASSLLVIHRMLWCKEGCAIPCAVMQAAVMIHTECWKRRCAIPALHMQAAVVIHRMLLEEGYPRCHASSAVAVMIHRMLWGRRLIQLAACKLAAVIHRMLWWKKVCIPAAMQARCCDSECSGGRRVCYPLLPCKLAAAVVTRMLVEGRCAIPWPCKPAVVIHRMLVQRRCASLAAMPRQIHKCSGARKGVLSLRCHASCCHDHRMLWWKKVLSPALPCKLLLL